jgi:hypothetical protein
VGVRVVVVEWIGLTGSDVDDLSLEDFDGFLDEGIVLEFAFVKDRR